MNYSLKYLQDKLESNRIINRETGCWHWMKHVANTGYGQIYNPEDGKLYSTHRVAMIIYAGMNPESDKLVCHKCPTRNCFNPDHLYLGDYHDNAVDKVKAGNGSFNYGSNSGRTKLIDQNVIQIRQMFDSKECSIPELANMYSLGLSTVRSIVRRKTWKHLK